MADGTAASVHLAQREMSAPVSPTGEARKPYIYKVVLTGGELAPESGAGNRALNLPCNFVIISNLNY